jgi:hypothetical protein
MDLAGGRAAGGVEFRGGGGWGIRTVRGSARVDTLQVKDRKLRPQMRPMCGGYAAEAVAIAAIGALDGEQIGFRDGRTVAGMRGFAHTTGMRGWCSDRQRQRDEASHEREEQ